VNELPTNNEVSKNRVKVVDFGIFGSNMGSIAEKSNCGSLKFMAPELLQGRTESTPKIDVWSMGIILYALVFGEYPFHDRDKEQLKK
jgi:serine/threonine protein kinase